MKTIESRTVRAVPVGVCRVIHHFEIVYGEKSRRLKPAARNTETGNALGFIENGKAFGDQVLDINQTNQFAVAIHDR